MSLIYLSDTPKESFTRGFTKGLAAPLMLFGRFNTPDLPRAEPVSVVIRSDAEVLAGDWLAIGLNFKNVVAQHHGKKADNSR